MTPWSRRGFIEGSARLMAGAAFIPGAFRLPTFDELSEAEEPYLEAAWRAWRWIESSEVATPHGITWPANPTDPASVGGTLYTHGPGVMPFALELFHATQDEMVLDRAKAGADHLLATLADVPGSGLYTGLAGVAFVLAESYRATKQRKYADAAHRATDLVIARAEELGRGVAWPTPDGNGGSIESNDIVSGTAGTGLTLLYLYEALGRTDALDTAHRAGERLLERATKVDGGLMWDMWPGYAREMPNFSHGTAGIAYFLATLAGPADEPAFLDAARQGGEYLQTIADVTDDTYLIRHHSPGGEDLYYLSWCHGPVGTNRLFYRLAQETRSGDWMEWVHMGARGIMATGVPERRTPGFWENISQCGGNAGLGEHYLGLYRMSGDAGYLSYVDRINDDLLRRGTQVGAGTKWTQSEHRVQPDLLVAQTGFMQGAAGVGKYLLHVHAMEREGVGPRIFLPDAPF